MKKQAMRDTVRVTKALSDAQRLRILMMLRGGELCVCQIVEALGLAASTVSKHLSILATADLVLSRKDGRWAYYHLPDPTADGFPQPALDWLGDMLRADERIKQDAKKLKSVTADDPEDVCRRQRPRSQKRVDETGPSGTGWKRRPGGQTSVFGRRS